MARYFLDTGVVVGYTFIHDLWRAEAERIFDSDNSLYVNDVVIYEYCVGTEDNSLETAEIDWEKEAGKFGEKVQYAEGIKPVFDMKLRTYEDSEITVDNFIDDFLSVTDIKDGVDETSIEEYVIPTLREFILEELADQGGRPLTVTKARNISESLFATIIDGARRSKDNELSNRVYRSTAPVDERNSFAAQIDHIVSGKHDPLILGEVGWLNEQGVLRRIITSDKNHMYSNKDKIKAKIGVNVHYIKDEVADPSLPS